jgi:autotransporter-associated beta strand protein
MKNVFTLAMTPIALAQVRFCKDARKFLRVPILAILLLAPSARAGQGAASYLDFDDVNPGFGTPINTDELSLNWSTSAAGTATATARPSGTQLTIGSAATDFSGPTPYVFSINLNGAGNLQGVVINSTNVNVTFTGSANTHNNSGPNFWTITNFSSLTVNDSRQTFAGTVKGMNWNNVAVTFQGPGTFNFPTPFGCNSTAVNTQNMSGVINLQMPPVTAASSYSGGYVLVAGTLNFASAGSANAFNGFGAGKNFIINGGTIDNTSGSPMVLSVGSAGYTLGGDLTFPGSSSVDFGPATVTLTGSRTITVGANSLTLGPIAGAGFGITKAGAGALILSGANTFTGTTTVTNGSTLALTNAGTLVGPLVLSGSPLDMTGSLNGTITPPAFSLTNSTLTLAIVSATGTNIVTPILNVGGSSTINIASLPLVTGYPTTYRLISPGALNGTLNFTLGSLPTVSPPYTGFLTTTGNVVNFVLTGGPVPVRTLIWNGLNNGSPDGTWDVATTPTWLDAGNSATTYNQSDIVTLNDTAAGQTSINMTTTLTPGSLTVSNNTKLYTLGGGSGKISGSVALNKRGAGTLILDEGAGNDFSGGVNISSGTLQVGNNDTAGNLPPSGNVVNNAALVFNRADTITVPTIISGSGTVAQNGSGTVMLSGANTFTGAVTVAQGTLQIGNNAALGTTNGTTTIANGATLDFVANANNIGQEIVSVSGAGVSGQGALVNSSGSATFVAPNIARVILTGDTTFGGSGRWDLRSAATGDPTQASLSTGGLARKITKIGGNQVGLVGVTVDPNLGDIEVQSGIFSMEAATTSLGNPAANLIVEPGATFQMFAITNFLNKVFTLGSDGIASTISATSGSNNVVGPMTLTNNCLFNVNNNTVSLTLNNVITGPGQITKIGAGLLTLSGNSPNYGGGLLVNAGSVTVSGTLSNALGITTAAGKFTLNGSLLGSAGLTNNAATFMAGSGNTTGPVDVLGTLSPGDTNVAGTLTVGNLTLESGATLNYDLGVVNTAGAGTNDLIVVNGDLTINGNSIFINPLGLLQIGVPYRLFNYTGNLIWNSDLQVQNQGSANYTFTLNTNTPGQINVVMGGGPPQWNGGSASDSNWSDPANWNGTTIFSGNALGFTGNNRLNNTNDTPADAQYSDIIFSPGAGAFTLNGNPIMPIGNVVNLSANPQTIKLGLDFNANFTLDGGAGGLIVGGGLTNTATAPTRTTVTLSGTGTLTNLLASTDPGGTNTITMTSSTANWTLMDNAASAQMTVPWSFDIRAGTFNFGTASSAPNLSSTTINGVPQDNQVGIISGTSGTFNMVNGTLTTVARLNTATVVNSTGIVNQVGGTLNLGQQFQGANGANANEQSIVSISGGTMNIANGTGPFYNASRGLGTLTVSGSGALNCGTLDLSRSIVSGTIGVVNLNGGTITASRVGTATANQSATSTGSTATFNFNGGTLKASASAANFFQGSTVAPIIPINSIVKAGGANIDDGGFAISILEPLQHDSLLGATLDGGLTKLGAGTVTLIATNTYTGPTLVNNGTLAVNGLLGFSAVTVQTGGTLAGTGAVTNATVNVGGAISPGGPGAIGTLTVSNNITLQGNANMDINKSTATNDVLKATSIALGGTLNVTNLAGTLSSGDSFKLFSASSLTGTITPLLPALWPGLSWNTSALNSAGIISVTGTRVPPQISSEAVSGGNFVISGSGGLAGATYYVLATNNVSAPLATWPRIATNVFDASGNFSASVPVDPGTPNRFFTILAP